MDAHHIIAERVRYLRTLHGLSQEQVADRAGLHRTHLQRVELGTANPTLDTLCRLAEALGISLAALVDTGQPIWPELETLVEMLKGREVGEIRLILDLTRVALKFCDASRPSSQEQA